MSQNFLQIPGLLNEEEIGKLEQLISASVFTDGKLTASMAAKEVKNNLQLRQAAEPSGRIGLQNIRKRYELISGQDITITKAEESFEVILPLGLLHSSRVFFPAYQ